MMNTISDSLKFRLKQIEAYTEYEKHIFANSFKKCAKPKLDYKLVKPLTEIEKDEIKYIIEGCVNFAADKVKDDELAKSTRYSDRLPYMSWDELKKADEIKKEEDDYCIMSKWEEGDFEGWGSDP